MFGNYFKVLVRNLVKNKMFSLLNILGLSIGLATCLLISLYIFDEASYDKHHVMSILSRQLADTMRDNERLKQENELFRKGFGLAQTIKEHRNKDSNDI